MSEIEEGGGVKVVIGKVDGREVELERGVVEVWEIGEVVGKWGSGSDGKGVEEMVGMGVIVLEGEENGVDKG